MIICDSYILVSHDDWTIFLDHLKRLLFQTLSSPNTYGGRKKPASGARINMLSLKPTEIGTCKKHVKTMLKHDKPRRQAETTTCYRWIILMFFCFFKESKKVMLDAWCSKKHHSQHIHSNWSQQTVDSCLIARPEVIFPWK